MGVFLFRRVTYGIFVLLGVALFTFALVHMTGDPAKALLPLGTPPEQIEAFRERAGFNEPLLHQFGRYVGDVLRGDFGVSLRHRQPAMDIVIERLPATLLLGGTAIFLAVAVAVPLGVAAATNSGKWPDRLATSVALLSQTLPGFWLGIMLILVFGVLLKWTPVSGGTGWKGVLLPAIVVATTPVGSFIRLLRTSMNEALTMDYIRTARAKGLAERIVVLRHGLKNALIPSLGLLSVYVGQLFGGALVAEIVFAYPGMGQLAMQAIANRDIPVIQAFVLLQGAVIVALNILLDGVHMAVDPRVKYE